VCAKAVLGTGGGDELLRLELHTLCKLNFTPVPLHLRLHLYDAAPWRQHLVPPRWIR